MEKEAFGTITGAKHKTLKVRRKGYFGDEANENRMNHGSCKHERTSSSTSSLSGIRVKIVCYDY
jgi:hypothetical protein